MFKKTLTAALAALTLTTATLAPMQSAQAGGLGKFVAAAVVGVAVGAIAAGKARSQEQGYQERGDRSDFRPSRGYDDGYRYVRGGYDRYEGGCGFRNSPIFDEDGNRIGSRRVPAC